MAKSETTLVQDIPWASKGNPNNGHPNPVGLEQVRGIAQNLANTCKARFQGHDDVIQLVIIALLADGHVLLEDHPGSGKTTLAKALGHSMISEERHSSIAAFRRIQFTPDLLPSDITGTTVFRSQNSQFEFCPGPVFANIVLADEINRTGPKVQAALLEAMAEKQVTVDTQTHKLDDLFFVLATQNPLDLMGTYPLPAAQLDRFLFKITMSHLDQETELDILARHLEDHQKSGQEHSSFQIKAVEIVRAREWIRQTVVVSPIIRECLVEIAQALRNDPRVAQGVSTRSLVQGVDALKSRAVIEGRTYVAVDDLKAIVNPLFSHRLQLHSKSVTASEIVKECCQSILEKAIRRAMKS